MSENHEEILDTPLSADFWTVPEDFIESAPLRLLHADIVARLRAENEGADTLEMMLIERIASLYFYMRFKESSGSMSSDAAYKGMLQLWITMAADLRKGRAGEADEQTVRQEITQGMVRAINKSLNGMEPEVARMVKRRIAEHMGAA